MIKKKINKYIKKNKITQKKLGCLNRGKVNGDNYYHWET